MTSILPLSAAQDRFAVHNTGFGWSEKELVEVIRCLNVAITTSNCRAARLSRVRVVTAPHD